MKWQQTQYRKKQTFVFCQLLHSKEVLFGVSMQTCVCSELMYILSSILFAFYFYLNKNKRKRFKKRSLGARILLDIRAYINLPAFSHI